MPSLTFYPQHQRHLTLAAAGHCLEHYRLLREQAEGRLAASVPGASLLIGIGMDAGVGCLWASQWDVGAAVEAARTGLALEYPGLATVAQIWPEVELGIRQYADQWGDGVRGWEVLAVHPYLDRGNHGRLVLRMLGDRTYLTMPDMEARVGGILTIVDQKTGAWPYKAQDWLWEPQLLCNCLALSRVHPGEPVQFLIDYMQRPKKQWKRKPVRIGTVDGVDASLPLGPLAAAGTDATWTFPLVHPIPFTLARRAVAESWLDLGARRREWFRGLQGNTMQDLRDPAQCHTWYGWCEFRERCFREEGAGNGDTP